MHIKQIGRIYDCITIVSQTPEGISINARNVSFELEQSLATDWADNDPFLTALFNAMSISFPSGEKNFIDSVRPYEKRITDEKLLKEVKGFYKQEGIHSREHRKYNKVLCEQRGYDLTKLEGVYLQRIEEGKSNPRVTPRDDVGIHGGCGALYRQFWRVLFRGPIVEKYVDGAYRRSLAVAFSRRNRA